MVLHNKIFFLLNVSVNQKNIKNIQQNIMNLFKKECTIKLNQKELIVSFNYNSIKSINKINDIMFLIKMHQILNIKTII